MRKHQEKPLGPARLTVGIMCLAFGSLIGLLSLPATFAGGGAATFVLGWLIGGVFVFASFVLLGLLE